MRLVLPVLVVLEGLAWAHLGGVVSNARFTNPAGPATQPADMGVTIAPFDFETADTEVTIAWTDGDMDPTGIFTFYYLPWAPSTQVTPTMIEMLGTQLRETGKAEDGVSIYASCECDADAGVVCGDPGTRDCRNAFMWDTHMVPNGTYWVVAVNNDPPYHVYSVASAPVRVQHGGGEPPPAALVLRPDGFGSWDKSYRVQWLAKGKPPLKIDLSYGLDSPEAVLGPVTELAKDVQAPVAADGTQSYDWDISQLETLKLYFLRVTVTDGDGRQTYTNSRFGLSVYHPSQSGSVPDASMAPDMATPPMPSSSSCASGAGAAAPTTTALALVLLLIVLARRYV